MPRGLRSQRPLHPVQPAAAGTTSVCRVACVRARTTFRAGGGHQSLMTSGMRPTGAPGCVRATRAGAAVACVSGFVMAWRSGGLVCMWRRGRLPLPRPTALEAHRRAAAAVLQQPLPVITLALNAVRRWAVLFPCLQLCSLFRSLCAQAHIVPHMIAHLLAATHHLPSSPSGPSHGKATTARSARTTGATHAFIAGAATRGHNRLWHLVHHPPSLPF